MMNQPAFLGIDVSKGYADFILLDTDKNILEEGFTLDDSKQGRQQLSHLVQKWFSQGITALYCGVESTGGYENNWFAHLCNLSAEHAREGQQILVTRLNPKVIKATGEAAMVRTQTDQTSANTIACYLLNWPQKIRYSPEDRDATWGETRQQIRFTEMLIKQRVQLVNQLEKLLYQHLSELLVYCRHGIPGWLLQLIVKYPTRRHLLRAGPQKIGRIKAISPDKAQSIVRKLDPELSTASASIAHTIKATARQILHLQEQIKAEQAFLTDQFADHSQVQLLDSIKGVGTASAVRFVVEIETITRFSSAGKLCSYFGVHPTWKQSGDGIWYQGMSKKGRSGVRATLYMCCLSMIRCEPNMKQLYHRFRGQGMNHYQAMGVLMHKLLRIIYGMLKNNTRYNPAIDRNNIQIAEQRRRNQQQKVQKQQTLRRRFMADDTESAQQAPISRRSYNKRKQEASQSSITEECAGSLPAKKIEMKV